MRAERRAHDELTIGVERLVDARRRYHLFYKVTPEVNKSPNYMYVHVCVGILKTQTLTVVPYFYFYIFPNIFV